MSFSTTHPPLTSNTLPTSQRTRLLKSTRKLEAVLGTTPIILETDSLKEDVDNRPPPTPRTKARRRRGWLVPQLPKPVIVQGDLEFDDDCTIVDIVLDQSDDKFDEVTEDPLVSQPTLPKTPTARRGRTPNKPRFPKSKALPKTPIGQGEFPFSARAVRTKKSFTRLHQPVIVPARRRERRESAMSVVSISSDSIVSPPVSPSIGFFQAPNHRSEAQDKEARRKKLAKLARTLGENVPPELVFPPSAPRKERRISFFGGSNVSIASAMKPLSHVNAPSMSTFAPPSHPVPAMPTPPVLAPAPLPPSPPKKFQRAHRPKSLSVPALSNTHLVEIVITNDDDEEIAAIPEEPTEPALQSAPHPVAATVGSRLQTKAPFRRPLTDFLDSPHGRVAFEGLVTMRTSLDDPRTQSSSNLSVEAPVNESTCRRKEREWSGEWNAKDMDSVKKRLRQLKGR